jgi:hypothetical protein
MTALIVIGLIAVGAVADAAVQRHASHPGVEPWRTS